MSELGRVTQACACVNHILVRYLRVPIAKAMRLDSPQEFDRAVAKLASTLRDLAGRVERDTLQEALQLLQVDWASTTAGRRRELLRRAADAARQALAAIPTAVRSALEGAADEAVEATRTGARSGQRLAIDSMPSAFDGRVLRFMTRSQTLFIRDDCGRKADAFSQKARESVAQGMAQGLGRDDIAEDIERAARKALLERPGAYWEVVAAAFMGRTRSYAQIGCYREAGITRYRIEAVMDERTSEVCQLLHGRVFSVRSAMGAFELAESANGAETVRRLSPWARRDAQGLYVVDGPQRVTIADRTPTRDLEGAGLCFPPYHGLCRSTTVAVLG